MSKDEKSSRAIATIVATASITLALGVTVAAFAGYLGPRPQPEAVAEAPAPVAEAPAPVAGAPAAPSVVLVPVMQQPAAPAPPQDLAPLGEAELLAVAAAPARDDDDDDDDDEDEDEGREHEREGRGPRNHERDHDD